MRYPIDEKTKKSRIALKFLFLKKINKNSTAKTGESKGNFISESRPNNKPPTAAYKTSVFLDVLVTTTKTHKSKRRKKR